MFFTFYFRNVSALGTPPEEGWYFDGSGYVQMEETDTNDESALNINSLEFKTLSPNGLLYFAPGSNGVGQAQKKKIVLLLQHK